MGGGASKLSQQQISTLTHEMKLLIDKYEKEGVSNEEMNRKLTHDYERIIKSLKSDSNDVKKAPLGIAAPKDNKSSLNAQKGSFNNAGSKGLSKQPSNKNSNNRTATRRRSFDNSPQKPPIKNLKPQQTTVKPIQKEKTAEKAIVNTKSESTINTQPESVVEPSHVGNEEATTVLADTTPAEEPAVDSWDSVTQQPYCTVCHMAFKSLAFLERHVKFSDLHKRNEELSPNTDGKKSGAGPTLVFDTSDGSLTKSISGTTGLPPTNEEGKNYKLLYNGSKLFWRTQDDVEMQFFHHVLPHMIEVICHDSNHHKEMNRVYLSYDKIFDILVEHGNIRSNENDVNTIRTAITTYILQRLQLNKDHENSEIFFTKLSSDVSNDTPVVTEIPPLLIPISVSRRRRSSKEEIDLTITQLTSDRAALCEATEKAGIIGNLVHLGAMEIFRKKWWTDLARPRKRWIWAMHRVIRQRLVAETKAILKARKFLY